MATEEATTEMEVEEEKPQSKEPLSSTTPTEKRAVPHADSDALQLPWVEKYRPKR